MTTTDWKNQLYFGDNLDILRNHVADASVDLIYLEVWPESHWPSFALRQADVFQSYTV